jgi:chemotaxis protein histidine kinase CheA
VRACFEGKPGQWSAWFFHLPSSLGAFRCLTVRSGDRRLCIPAWAVCSVQKLTEKPLAPGTKEVWSLDETLARYSFAPATGAADAGMKLELAAGTMHAVYLVDEVLESEEVFMKPLPPAFNGQGRFLGVAVIEPSPERARKASEDSSDELALVLDPAYLVYGEAATNGAAGAGEARHVG